MHVLRWVVIWRRHPQLANFCRKGWVATSQRKLGGGGGGVVHNEGWGGGGTVHKEGVVVGGTVHKKRGGVGLHKEG